MSHLKVAADRHASPMSAFSSLSREELGICPLTREHTAAWWAALERSRSALECWEGWPEAVRSQADAESLLEKVEGEWVAGRAYHFGVFWGEELVGCVTLGNVLWDCRCADLGYWVDATFQGRGIAAWAARSLVKQALGMWRLQRLQIIIRVDNAASQRVAEKLGASFEGIARKRIFHADRAWDARVYAIVS